MNALLTIESEIHFHRLGRGNPKMLREGAAPNRQRPRVSRIARLMALALRFDRLIREGAIADYAELARVGHVSRARVSQIMNLLQLAPDIQELLLFHERVSRQRDPFPLWRLQPIAAVLDWQNQRRLWLDLKKVAGG